MSSLLRQGVFATGLFSAMAAFASPEEIVRTAEENERCRGSQSAGGAAPRKLTLYMDQKTKQILAEPGPGRIKLGAFQSVDDCAPTRTAANEPAKSPNAGVDDYPAPLVLTDEKHSFTVGLSGRLHADYNYQDDDFRDRGTGDRIDAASGTEIRRARIGIEGEFAKNFEYMLEADFADNNVGVKDAFLVYNGVKPLDFTIGQQKQAISMELQESSNDIMFTERSLINSMTGPLFDRAIGVNLKGSGKNWSAQLGVYGDTIDANKNTQLADEGYGVSSRLTWAPINDKGRVIHLGAYGGTREASADNEILDGSARYSYEITHMANVRLTNTGTLADFDRAYMGGAEFGAMYGPVSLQSEYVHTTTQRSNGRSTLDFDAGYVQMGWTLTGEPRRYKGSDGEFKGLRPDQPFDLEAGTWGAFELAGRLDYADLNDQDIRGGEETRATAALNWYLNDHVRLMADYSRILDVNDSPVTNLSGGSPDGLNVVTFRTQWAF